MFQTNQSLFLRNKLIKKWLTTYLLIIIILSGALHQPTRTSNTIQNVGRENSTVSLMYANLPADSFKLVPAPVTQQTPINSRHLNLIWKYISLICHSHISNKSRFFIMEGSIGSLTFNGLQMDSNFNILSIWWERSSMCVYHKQYK